MGSLHMGGYAGWILHVDLTSSAIRPAPLDLEFAREHIGGLGFGTAIYLDLIKDESDIDALSSDNPFVLMTGPLTGIKMDGVARWTVGSKSPLTGVWGECNIGGFLGAELKFAGYDGIVITGRADRPIYILIDDDTIEIRDAEKYWGKDIYTVNDEIIAHHRGQSKKPGQVFAIGPAGENLVRFASIINNKRHVAGRTGMGAVWGAKKLKAIFARGTGKLKIAHPDRLDSLRRELREQYEESPWILGLRAAGTASWMDVGVLSGDIPMKNWKQADWEHFEEIAPGAYGERILTGRRTCYGCGVACKREAEVKDGPFKFTKGPGPEYETLATFGTMCLNPNIESIGKANDLCNRYGMDSMTCGSTIAFAIECFENGLINEKDTDGLKLTWGNAEAIVALAEKIGKREGFGSILAEGSARAADLMGGHALDFLTTVKGLEAPMHDPRFAHGHGLAYAVSPRGACHNASLDYLVEGTGMYLPEIPELAEQITEMSSVGKARLNIACQDFGVFFSSCAVFCNLGAHPLNATQAVDMVNHVTGFDYTIEEATRLGRRIWYLKRGLSNLFGARAEHDRLPKRLTTPMDTGPTKGSLPDMDLMLKEFYEFRGINDDGVPAKAVLEALGLHSLTKLLHQG
jgi:aldehyde:ferredoxin oxidoreductase